MKFQRTTRLFRGQLDAAPVLCVLFPLAFFALLPNHLVLPAGTRIQLPKTSAPRALHPGESAFVVAIDAHGRLYFENQPSDISALGRRLRTLTRPRGAPEILLIEADAAVSGGRLAEVMAAATQAGLSEVVVRVSPRDGRSPTPSP